MMERKLFPMFDMAYQASLASGRAGVRWRMVCSAAGLDSVGCQPAIVVPLCSAPLPPAVALSPQGFASGDCDRDAQAVRVFLADGHQLALAQVRGQVPQPRHELYFLFFLRSCPIVTTDSSPFRALPLQSFAKNMGLYGQRIGVYVVVGF